MSRAGPFGAWERAIALRYLRARKGEAGLSVIAIISFFGFTVAVFSLITVMSVMNGFRAELLDKTLGFNGHLYIEGPALTEPGQVGIDRRAAIVRQVLAVPNVTQAVPLVESQAIVQTNTQTVGAIVRGISPEDLRRTGPIAESIAPRQSLATFGQGPDGGDEVIMGSRMAQILGVEPGDTVEITGPSVSSTAFGPMPTRKVYTVSAVFTVGMSQFDANFIYMPLSQAQLFFGRGTNVDVIEVKMTNPDLAVPAHIPIQRVVGPGAFVQDWTQRDRTYFNALQVERNVMRLILGILVLIAGLLILSSLIMLVKIKSRDIAILRTMGATKGSILRIFVMTGSAIGIAGTICGLVLGVLFCLNIEAIQTFVEWVTGTQVFSADIYFLSHVPAKIEWAEVAIITTWSVLASFLFTLWPAFGAAALDPVEALRYE